MNQQGNYNMEVIDLREILAILRKRFMVIVVLTLIALVTSAILSYFVMAPVYETKAVLLVTQAAPEDKTYSYYREEGMEGLMNTITKLPEMTINTYVGQLKSEAVLERVVKKLKLDQNGYSANSLAGSIDVSAVKDTNLIELKVTHTDPVLASKIANTLAAEFLDFMSQSNEEQMGKSVEFLKKQADQASTELKNAVAGLNKLESQPRGVAMLEQQIAAKSEDLSEYQSQSLLVNVEYQQLLAGKRQALVQLKSTPPTIKVTEFDEKTGQTVTVEEVNPAYTQLKAIVNEKTVAAAEKGVQAKSLQAMVKSLGEELKVLQAELGQKKNTLEMAKKEVERLQGTDNMLRSKIDETKIGKSMKLGETNLMVVSPAMVPEIPVKPNKMLNMAIAFVAGLMVSVGLAFLLNYLDNTVKSPKDVEEIFGLPVLGQVPYYNLDKPSA